MDGEALSALPYDTDEFKMLLSQCGIRINIKMIITKHCNKMIILYSRQLKYAYINNTVVIAFYTSLLHCNRKCQLIGLSRFRLLREAAEFYYGICQKPTSLGYVICPKP